jgi:hypothetical protein
MALDALHTIGYTVYPLQIAIEPAAQPAALPPATSCIVGLPTPADAACGYRRERPASANLHKGGSGIDAQSASHLLPKAAEVCCGAEDRQPWHP